MTLIQDHDGSFGSRPLIHDCSCYYNIINYNITSIVDTAADSIYVPA